MNPLQDRIQVFDQLTRKISKLPSYGVCNEPILRHHNINDYITVLKELGSGTFNIISEICLKNDTSCDPGFIMRKSKNFTESVETDRADSCVSDRYSLLFSDLVKRNIWPHFPLTVGSFICNDLSSPISIQEKATHDVNIFLINNSLFDNLQIAQP